MQINRSIFNVKFDLVISNPPYIVKREINQLSEDIKNFEPKSALNGGNDGLDVIKSYLQIEIYPQIKWNFSIRNRNRTIYFCITNFKTKRI